MKHLFNKKYHWASQYLSSKSKKSSAPLDKYYKKIEKEINFPLVKQGRTIGVDRINNLSEKDFIKNYLNKSIPVIFNKQAIDWECLKKWNYDYLMNQYGDQKVTIYNGEGLIEDELLHFEETTYLISIKDLIQKIKRGSKLYLRFSSLIEVNRSLIFDLDNKWLKKMRRCLLGISYQTFIGGKGRKTPLHSASSSFFYVMIDGQKKWYMCSAQNTYAIKPVITDKVYNFSKLDLRNIDYNKYPLMKYIDRYECTLEKGDILFIPAWMWHQVENLSMSWGLSYRFSCLRNFIKIPAFVVSRLFFEEPSFTTVFLSIFFKKYRNKTSNITPQIYIKD